ncbi:translation initiation factor eIF3 subunit [Podochytrium sp. JEL0797]|nr:translation initiation factor eIF3 subunit [Podochytrium sp. JEL0797]
MPQRPILLHGHLRSLTRILYNSDGDLLFSASKDNKPCVWYSANGERLGTFNGHNGAVWDLAVTKDSRYLLSGSADNTCKMWEVETGRCVYTWETKTAVRCVDFALGDEKALFVTDATMGQKSTIHIVPIEADPEDQTSDILRSIVILGPKVTVAVWGNLNRTIITGHEDGTVTEWNADTGDKIQAVKNHDKDITDIQFSADKSHFMTSSKDHAAYLTDSKTLKVMKRFVTERPVNSAILSPIRPHVVLGGGQDAMSVTTTSLKGNKFESRFYHAVFEDEIGRIKGHFGPINTLAFHPNGHSFSSGGEDGFIRIHHLDEDYFEFKYDEENLEELPQIALTRSPSKSAPPQFDSEENAEPIQLHLNGTTLSYENREWATEDAGVSSAVVKELMEKNNALEAENQLLKFKLGVMLDMMATTKLDALTLQQKLNAQTPQR